MAARRRQSVSEDVASQLNSAVQSLEAESALRAELEGQLKRAEALLQDQTADLKERLLAQTVRRAPVQRPNPCHLTQPVPQAEFTEFGTVSYSS